MKKWSHNLSLNGMIKGKCQRCFEPLGFSFAVNQCHGTFQMGLGRLFPIFNGNKFLFLVLANIISIELKQKNTSYADSNRIEMRIRLYSLLLTSDASASLSFGKARVKYRCDARSKVVWPVQAATEKNATAIVESCKWELVLTSE